MKFIRDGPNLFAVAFGLFNLARLERVVFNNENRDKFWLPIRRDQNQSKAISVLTGDREWGFYCNQGTKPNSILFGRITSPAIKRNHTLVF